MKSQSKVNLGKKYSTLIKNSLWGSGSFVFITIISFLILPFIIAKLSIEGYGIYILITSIVGYYGILDLGLGNALIKYVAEYYKKNEITILNSYINSAVVFQGIVGIIASGMILLFTKEIISILNINSKDLEIANTALNLAALGFFFTFIGGAYRSVIQGLQLFKYSSILDGAINLLLNLSLLVILTLGFGLIGAIAVNVIVSILSFLLYLLIVKKKLPTYVISLSLNIQILKQIFNFSVFVFLSKISNIFSTYIVRFVISFFLGPVAVTYYVVPSKLVGALGGIASSAVSAIFPFSSQLSATADTQEIKKLFLQSSRIFAAVLIPIVVFILLFSKQILTIWMGTDFAEKTWLVLSIISFSGFIGSFSAIPNLIVLGQGNSKLIGIFSFLTIVLYVIFLPLLTKYFGIIGTSFALLIATSGVIYYVILRTSQFMHILIKDYFLTVLKPHIFVFFIAIILFFLLQKTNFPNPLIVLSLGVLLMSLHYFYLFKNKVLPFNSILKQIFQKA